jgi:hypothetical protein
MQVRGVRRGTGDWGLGKSNVQSPAESRNKKAES